MKRSILIFGAGINQLTLIEAANELGVISVVIDPNPEAPGQKTTDYFYCVSGDDYEGTKKIAIKHNVNGIVTGQMERPLRLMARLAAELGFIFHSPEVVEKSLNKHLMKQAFIQNDVPCARGKLLRQDDSITSDSLKTFEFPLILKPKDAFSSRGVYKIESLKDIKKYVRETRSFSSNGDILIEEFLEGPEYSIESITYKGETIIVQYTEKFITPFPYTVEMGHLQPAELNIKERKQIELVVKKAIKAIGINNSASHCEVKLTKNGAKVLEIGARLGGDFIASYLTLASTGVNMDKAAVQVALGEKPDLKHKYKKFSYIKYIELEAGKRIVEVKDWSDILNDPNIVFANVFVKPGETIPRITDSAKRPACVLVQGNSKKQVFEIAERKAEMLKSRIILKGNYD